jgi:dimethylamine monooxygenase subunit A
MDETLNIMEEEKGRNGEEGKLQVSSSASLPLPAFNIPFVVKSKSDIRADLTKLPVTMHEQWQEKHFVFDEQYGEYVKGKLEQLRHHSELSHVCVKDFDESALIECARVIFKKLAEEYPDYVSIEGVVVSLHLLGVMVDLETLDVQQMSSFAGRVAGKEPFAPTMVNDIYDYFQTQHGVRKIWDALALAVQEDLVIMKDDGDAGISELMHVCFPSHWNPGERVGQSLYGLHQPVANNELLLKASKNTLQAMVSKGPFIRFVWSFNSTSDLSQNPAFHTHGRKKPLSDDPSEWFFRVERQTTLPMPELQRSLFTIRIFVAPLPSVLNDERRKRLQESVLSMTEQLLTYKGLITKKDVLLEYLQRP